MFQEIFFSQYNEHTKIKFYTFFYLYQLKKSNIILLSWVKISDFLMELGKTQRL